MIVISAANDSSRGENLGWMNKGSQNTEVWHIPHEFQPNRPLCHSSLSGQFKRTKGKVNCTRCLNCYSLTGVASSPLREALLVIDEGKHIPTSTQAWRDLTRLYDADLVGDKSGRVQLTSRGKIVVMDLKAPASWFDPKGRVLHRRWALRAQTACMRDCFIQSDIPDFLAVIAELHAQAKKRKDPTITCVECVVLEDPNA